jgi:DnaJ-class molecular chaperone
MSAAHMKTCPECNGEGEVEYEIPVVDYVNGGYLTTKWDDCQNCGGTGEIDDWDDEDDA